MGAFFGLGALTDFAGLATGLLIEAIRPIPFAKGFTIGLGGATVFTAGFWLG